MMGSAKDSHHMTSSQVKKSIMSSMPVNSTLTKTQPPDVTVKSKLGMRPSGDIENQSKLRIIVAETSMNNEDFVPKPPLAHQSMPTKGIRSVKSKVAKKKRRIFD
mmetsp:Transcript_38629/g.58792  ORF Transcript_38629/g.58792 Transcript_38629/m.58792 type:complete len:105 (+) Transcript_38629:364-678(+)